MEQKHLMMRHKMGLAAKEQEDQASNKEIEQEREQIEKDKQSKQHVTKYAYNSDDQQDATNAITTSADVQPVPVPESHQGHTQYFLIGGLKFSKSLPDTARYKFQHQLGKRHHVQYYAHFISLC